MTPFIYTITALTCDSSKWRVFGYYFSETDARAAVEQNYGDMEECLYSWIVVERVNPGVHGGADAIAWYRWEPNEYRWEPATTAPVWSKGVINFSMG